MYSVVPVLTFNVSRNEVQGFLQHVSSYVMEVLCVCVCVCVCARCGENCLRSYLFFSDRYGRMVGSPASYLEDPDP